MHAGTDWKTMGNGLRLCCRVLGRVTLPFAPGLVDDEGCAFCVRQGIKLKDPPLPCLCIYLPYSSNIQQAIPQVLSGLLGRSLIQTLGFTSTSSVAPICSTLAPSAQSYSYTTPRHATQPNTTQHNIAFSP
jgi:hypothetical protein